jgi:hypothetical protein
MSGPQCKLTEGRRPEVTTWSCPYPRQTEVTTWSCPYPRQPEVTTWSCPYPRQAGGEGWVMYDSLSPEVA